MTQIPQSPASRAKSKGMAAQIERRKRIDAAKVQCDDWNRAYPVGTKVKLELANSRVFVTPTESEAKVNLDGIAVVLVYNITYAVRIEDCEVLK